METPAYKFLEITCGRRPSPTESTRTKPRHTKSKGPCAPKGARASSRAERRIRWAHGIFGVAGRNIPGARANISPGRANLPSLRRFLALAFSLDRTHGTATLLLSSLHLPILLLGARRRGEALLLRSSSPSSSSPCRHVSCSTPAVPWPMGRRRTPGTSRRPASKLSTMIFFFYQRKENVQRFCTTRK
ncbi:hypothetical protein SORBI_3009G215350 [Sorghum bicolor]|uniref:Uncharacterized protein n=1 Tax=Sorghum bicolor TaxID=4558 RepID=A0A1Z5R4J9_SORBI|nr:hypothetical protein SORBI_3009G215350 [Sorghum bicolor]OQU78372.1 hypothetical protein SORBI_3009G215350 [Sorghum bicolor]OQU78374.1 hypothetical protein SORBI_3009G215350 [Sorghum bicolor]OQU78375.1 hypothetical protein SORBI_3009G215350 [Sorghum bicolor]